MATQKVVVKQLQGITLAGKANSNRWVMMDGPESFGGSDAAIRPKELLLISLGGCTGSDVISILQKKRVKLDGFEINLTADTSEEHPQVYTKIHIEYVFYGDKISDKDVERAIELSETKYCSVSAMLRNSVEITNSYRIEKNIESQ
ncbi:MAG: OsmC family protein [Ignavibacteriales bacterium]|nr:OsmC family protein [Ignavibacteriales bacterium]